MLAPTAIIEGSNVFLTIEKALEAPCLSGGSVISTGTGQNWPGIFSLFELLINLGGKFSPWRTVNLLEQ